MFVVKQEKAPLDSRTKKTMGTRFGLEFLCVFSNNSHPGKLHCTSFSQKRLCLDDRQLEQTQEERLVGLDIDPSLSWSSHIANLRTKALKARCCTGSH